MFTYHCYTCMPCLHITVTCACHVFISLLHVQSMFHVTVFMLYNCFLLLIWISRYWTCELLICNMWNPTSIVPVSRYIVPVSRYNVLCYQQSSGPIIMLPVSCTVICILLHCILDIADYNDNLGMRETWRLIRSYRVMYWIHCLSHCKGRGSAGYRLLLLSIPLLF